MTVDVRIGRVHIVDRNDLVVGVAAAVPEEPADDELQREVDRSDEFHLVRGVDRQVARGVDLGVGVCIEGPSLRAMSCGLRRTRAGGCRRFRWPRRRCRTPGAASYWQSCRLKLAVMPQ